MMLAMKNIFLWELILYILLDYFKRFGEFATYFFAVEDRGAYRKSSF